MKSTYHIRKVAFFDFSFFSSFSVFFLSSSFHQFNFIFYLFVNMVETRRSKRLSSKVPSSSAAVSSDDDDFQPVIGTTKRAARSQTSSNKRVKSERRGDLKKVKEQDSSVPTLTPSDTDQDSLASPQSTNSKVSKEIVTRVKSVFVGKAKKKKAVQMDQDEETQVEDRTPSRSPSVDDVKSEASSSSSVDDVKSEASSSSSVDDVKSEVSRSPSVDDVKSEVSPLPIDTLDSLAYNSEAEEEPSVASSEEEDSSDDEVNSENEAALGTHPRLRNPPRRRQYGTYRRSEKRRWAHSVSLMSKKKKKNQVI
jgi:hypothetical protein